MGVGRWSGKPRLATWRPWTKLGELKEAWVVLGKVWRGGGCAMHQWFWWFVATLTGQLGGPSLHMRLALPLVVRVLRLSPLVTCHDRSSFGSREHLDIVVVMELVHRIHVAQWFSISFESHLVRHHLGFKLWCFKLREQLIRDAVVIIVVEAQLGQLEVVVLVSQLLLTSKSDPGLLLLLLLASKLKGHVRA